jgi:hypothetical protein
MREGFPSSMRAALARFRRAAVSPPGALERGEALLASAHDLGERLLELAGEHDVLEVRSFQLEAEGLEGRPAQFHQAFAELAPLLQEVVDRRCPDEIAQGELEGDVERHLEVLDLVNGRGGIDHPILGGHADPEGDPVGAQDLLTGHRDMTRANVDRRHGDRLPVDPVLAGLEDAGEASAPVFERPLVLEDDDSIEQDAEDDQRDQREADQAEDDARDHGPRVIDGIRAGPEGPQRGGGGRLDLQGRRLLVALRTEPVGSRTLTPRGNPTRRTVAGDAGAAACFSRLDSRGRRFPREGPRRDGPEARAYR